MNIRSKKKGLTLVEVLISIAILGIIIAPIGYMGLSSTKNSVQGKENQQGTYLGQRVLEQIKPVNTTSISDLFTQIQHKFPSFVASNTANNGTIYYDVNGNEANDHNYKYKVDIALSEESHSQANDHSGSLSTQVLNINNFTTMNINGTDCEINGGNIVLRFELNNNRYEIFKDDGADPIWSFNEDALSLNNNVIININGNFGENNILKIKLENNTDENFNVYTNKAATLTNANYTVTNSFGRVNVFSNYNDNVRYVQINNSVKLDMTVYKSDGQQIAHLEQYKNLGE